MLLVPPALVSSNIGKMGYEPLANKMQIQFLKSGNIYEYQNVPLVIFTQIFNGALINPKTGLPSCGHTFWALVRQFPGQYPYTRIGAQTPDGDLIDADFLAPIMNPLWTPPTPPAPAITATDVFGSAIGATVDVITGLATDMGGAFAAKVEEPNQNQQEGQLPQ